jgi:toxin secretion/phage lysis holin
MSILAELIVELRILMGLNLRTPWYGLCAMLGLTTAGVLEFTDTYMWSPPITLLLVFLTICIDSATGMLYAWRQKRWESRKAFRGVFKAVAYIGLLMLAHNYGRAEPSLNWLPVAILVPMVLFLLASVIKNLSLLGWLPPRLASILYERIDAYKNPDVRAESGDMRDKSGEGTGRMLAVLLCVGLLLSSCSTERACKRKYPCVPTTVERVVQVRDTTILTPEAVVDWILLPCPGEPPSSSPLGGESSGEQTRMTVPANPVRASLPVQGAAGLPGIVADTTGQAELSWYYDAQGRLHVRCRCKAVPHTLKGAIRQEAEQRTRVETEHVRGFWWWSGVVAWVLLAVSVIITVSKRLKPL